ncbi:MAG: helix-turn-helix domain-containing protein [Clostridiales Family XIII bacterium]|nr:helix-turn-helix domain-containing protein [Clostridiales Family XIII bacterium]
MSGVRQAVISRAELGQTSPTIDTLLRVLAPLGKTLVVAPREHAKR